jgi:hypothetical protein
MRSSTVVGLRTLPSRERVNADLAAELAVGSSFKCFQFFMQEQWHQWQKVLLHSALFKMGRSVFFRVLCHADWYIDEEHTKRDSNRLIELHVTRPCYDLDDLPQGAKTFDSVNTAMRHAGSKGSLNVLDLSRITLDDKLTSALAEPMPELRALRLYATLTERKFTIDKFLTLGKGWPLLQELVVSGSWGDLDPDPGYRPCHVGALLCLL